MNNNANNYDTSDDMDSNIIDDYCNLPINERTNDEFDNLIRILEIVWPHKVYQDTLLHSQEVANREPYDLSMSLAQGLISQDDGSKETMILCKDKFNSQQNSLLSTFTMNNVETIFTKRHLHQIVIYYNDRHNAYFTENEIID